MSFFSSHTKIMRFFPLSNSTTQAIPIFMSRIPAGRATQNDYDAIDSLDFNKDILVHPENLIYALATGDSMKDAGIVPGTLLVVDRTAEAVDGCIAIVSINGEKAVKKIEKRGARFRLISANTEYQPIEVDPTERLEVFGVVQFSIRCHKPGPHLNIFHVK